MLVLILSLKIFLIIGHLLSIVLRDNVRSFSIHSVNLRCKREITLAAPLGVPCRYLAIFGRLVLQQRRLLILARRLAGECGHANNAHLRLEWRLIVVNMVGRAHDDAQVLLMAELSTFWVSAEPVAL